MSGQCVNITVLLEDRRVNISSAVCDASSGDVLNVWHINISKYLELIERYFLSKYLWTSKEQRRELRWEKKTIKLISNAATEEVTRQMI